MGNKITTIVYQLYSFSSEVLKTQILHKLTSSLSSCLSGLKAAEADVPVGCILTWHTEGRGESDIWRYSLIKLTLKAESSLFEPARSLHLNLARGGERGVNDLEVFAGSTLRLKS